MNNQPNTKYLIPESLLKKLSPEAIQTALTNACINQLPKRRRGAVLTSPIDVIKCWFVSYLQTNEKAQSILKLSKNTISNQYKLVSEYFGGGSDKFWIIDFTNKYKKDIKKTFFCDSICILLLNLRPDLFSSLTSPLITEEIKERIEINKQQLSTHDIKHIELIAPFILRMIKLEIDKTETIDGIEKQAREYLEDFDYQSSKLLKSHKKTSSKETFLKIEDKLIEKKFELNKACQPLLSRDPETIFEYSEFLFSNIKRIINSS